MASPKVREKARNLIESETLRANSRHPYTITGNAPGVCCAFRVAGRPRCNFYPAGKHWVNLEDNTHHGGGAFAFLAWYEQQEQSK